VLMSCCMLFAQQPAPAPASAPATPANAQENKDRTIPSFLIVGTVFNESALSFPGVQVRIRKKDEKKFRWETYTNSRGEFAVRVFPGYAYELVTHAKKYQDQSHAVDAKVDVQQRLSIKLEPVSHPEAATKP
jgi:Carboxypeptidase regulatory-like domain